MYLFYTTCCRQVTPLFFPTYINPLVLYIFTLTYRFHQYIFTYVLHYLLPPDDTPLYFHTYINPIL